MVEALLEVQSMDYSQNGGGVVCDETETIHSEGEKNKEKDSQTSETSDWGEQARIDCQDQGDDIDTLCSAYKEMRESSASLELSIFKSVNHVYALNQLEASDQDFSKEKLLPEWPQQEVKREIDQMAFREIRSAPGKENVKVQSGDRGQKAIQLEAELREMRQFVERIQTERLNAEKAKESSNRRVLEIQVELEAAQLVAEEVKADNEVKDKAYEKQQRILNEALEKLETHRHLLHSGSVEANRGEDPLEFQESTQDMIAKLAEKDGMLRNLRECQEQLRLSFKRKEENHLKEKEEIITALEAAESQSEEQRVKLCELENDMTRLKGQTVNLEKRCAAAESQASDSSSLLADLQTKLDSTTMELFELKNSNAQADTMKMRLQECERALSHATAQRALADNSMREFKLREEQLEDVEKSRNGLQEQLKWRNEQFQSLEEAHSKLRFQFKEKSSEYDTERAGLLSEIDSLQGKFDSKERLLQDLQSQLRMVHQALSHEESRRKVLELQAAEAREGFEHATAGYEAAQSAIEGLREQTSLEIGTLRDAVGAKERHLKDLQVKHLHMEQEFSELKSMEKEYRAWQCNQGEQEKQILFMKEKLTSVVEAHENLRSRMKAQEKEFDIERRELLRSLDLANDSLSSKDKALQELESQLERVNGALEQVKGHRVDLDAQLKQCKEQLEGVCEEAAMASQALTSLETSSNVEKSLMLESLHGKDRVIQDLKAQICALDQTVAELSVREGNWLQMEREYQMLQQLQTQGDADKKELGKIHDALRLRLSEEEKAWSVEREKLVTELQIVQERADEADKQLKETLFKYEMHRDVNLKLEARCALHDKELEEHCLRADQATNTLTLKKLEIEKAGKEAQTLNESLSAALSHKDLTLQQLRDQIGSLEADLLQKDEETISQIEKFIHLERRFQESSQVQCNMKEHISAMKSQACKAAEELKMLEGLRNTLEEELRKTHEVHLSTKRLLEGKLEELHRDSSSNYMQLKSATQRLDEESAQKELLLKDLNLKESILEELREETKILQVEKAALEQVVPVLEAKKGELMQEVESSKTAISQLCNKYDAAQASLAASCRDVKDLQAKIQNAYKVGAQLLEAEDKNKDLEGYLKAAKAIAQDKEEKLVASEWAVQQLALDVGKAKTALSQKDREEALLRDELADVERQLRGKEGALIELECYLEDALMAKESMQGEVDKLYKRMEDLDRGAADWKKQELDMTSQLEVVAAALEEEREALATCLLEVKRGNDVREVMDGAIESLKLQLAVEQREFSIQQMDMNRLCEDLERSKGEANSSGELVKELQGRLQQLEQSSEDRIKQFQSTLSEVKDELSQAHAQLEDFQTNTRSLAEESSRHKQKYEALLDLNERKDYSLKEMEAQLLNVQEDALKQSNVLEKREQELKLFKEQHQYQAEKEIGLQESLLRIQSQRSQLQLDNEELEFNLRKLKGQLDSASTESSWKSKEIDRLKIQVEQLTVIAAQAEETQILMTKLTDELQLSSHAVQDREGHLCALKVSLEEAQRELMVLRVALASKDSDMELLSNKLHLAEKRQDDSRAELIELNAALSLAQRTVTKKSEAISSYQCKMNVMEVESAEWKGKADASIDEGWSLRQDLQAASTSATESQKQVSEMQEMLEGLQLELKEKTERLVLHVASVEELQMHLKEWKEACAAAVEEKQAMKAALEVAEVHALEKDTVTGSLQEALEHASGEVSKYVVLVETLQAELAALRTKDADAAEQGEQLRQLLKITQEKAELNQKQIAELQDALERSGCEVKENSEQLSYHISSLSSLQEELLQWKSKNAAAERDVVSLKAQLEGAEDKEIQHREEVVQLREELIKAEHALTEERSNMQASTRLEHDLIEERIKVAASVSLIANLQADVEGWKAKAQDAAKEGERVRQELAVAVDTASSLALQVDAHQQRERPMEELNNKLQVELNLAREEVFARKGKMESFLHQLEQSQASEKKLLNHLQIEHKKLVADLEIGGGFDCTFEIDSFNGLQAKCPRKVIEDRAAPTVNNSITGVAVSDNISPEGSQTSAEDCTLAVINKALEKEVAKLTSHAEEVQYEAQQLAGKLDAALSNVATKNLIIKQVNDELMGLRSQVKRLEQETLSIQDSFHGEHSKIATDKSTFVSERDDGQQNMGLGKRKAESQEELNHYLELCDSLVRKNIRLEKQLDGLQRKNRGLQKQVEGLQMLEKTLVDKERKALDPVDCSPDQVLQEIARKNNLNMVKFNGQDRKIISLQDACKGKVLGEIDENVLPGSASLDRFQMSRRPPISPAAAMQQKKARRVKDDV